MDPDLFGSGSGGCVMQFLGRQLLQVGVDGGAWIQIYTDPDAVVA